MAFYNQPQHPQQRQQRPPQPPPHQQQRQQRPPQPPTQPYSLNVSCQKNHLGYIIGKGGRVIESLIRKWNGRIHNIFVKDPESQFGRPTHHLEIIGEEKAVHILALEINEMIKVSMGRTETKLKCGMNDVDNKLQCQQTTNLKIALLEEELRVLKEETERIQIESEWGPTNPSSWNTGSSPSQDSEDSEDQESSDETDSEDDEMKLAYELFPCSAITN